MTKYVSLRALLFSCLLLAACNTTPPEQYFDVAVLNSNMLVGFADEGEARQLESPSVKMGGNGQEVPMQRNEVITARLTFIGEDLQKLKGLKATPDTKEMLQTSLEMYEYVLPVYKNDYMQLARLYDEGASAEKIQSHVKAIHDKYYTRYKELYAKLISIGKLYAERHSIKVNWAM